MGNRSRATGPGDRTCRVWQLPSLLLGCGLLVLGGCAGQPGTPAHSVTPPAWEASRAAATAVPALHLPVPDKDKWIVHTLDRIGYGPRPGDLERVRRIGLARYLGEQLHPGGIPDEALQAKLAALPTLSMSSAELVAAYPPPTPAEQRARIEALARQAAARTMGGPGRAMAEGAGPGQAAGPPPPEYRPQEILAELSEAKLLRAISSERQLQETLTDFWFNHFNVFSGKAVDRWLVTSFERDAIRPHVLGRFRDLLEATARHPAMLFYLDNWISSKAGGPNGVAAMRGQGKPAGPTGLNENYARELLELHTLGVDGGYTQQDVIEVARCFTGWSLDRPRQGGGFLFRPRWHDEGEKIVLGVRIPAGGGMRDGEMVLDLLARHPATARHIATQLIQRFVSDSPPPSLVERTARVFRQTDGDLRAVMRTILTSPEFFSDAAYRAKVKTPLEFVASALRAVGADVAPGPALPAILARLGEPLYQAQPPTGYPDSADAWMNPGALLGRMNFALALAGGRVPGVRVDLNRLTGPTDRAYPERVLNGLQAAILPTGVSTTTRRALWQTLGRVEASGGSEAEFRGGDLAPLAALILGSPEFQRR